MDKSENITIGLKYILPITSLLLFLYGLLMLGATFWFGINAFFAILTLTTLFCFIALFTDSKSISYRLLLIVSVFWLFYYFERLSFLMFYDSKNIERLIIVFIPIFLAFVIFRLILKNEFEQKNKKLSWKHLIVSIVIFFLAGLLSFGYKSHTDEFNCWYYFDNNSEQYKILFAQAPKYTFEVIESSNELKQIVKEKGITYECRKGYYCPETKIKVITSFKKVIRIEILEFRNTEVNKLIKFKEPFEINVETIKGKKSLLQPTFIDD